MLNNLLTIGKSALTTAQAWVSVTGDNIANANTEGYARRYVVQNEAPAVNNYAGEIGLGANAEQVLRYFDKFLEDGFISESTLSSRWTEYDNVMETLESIFNEANTIGLSDTLNKFFNAWQKLGLYPEDPSVRTSVLTNGQTVQDMFYTMTQSVRGVQDEMNISIDKAVTRVNEIIEGIAKLNYQIDMSMMTPDYSPNSLYDQRDLLVEELATILDIRTVDSGAGSYRVQLSTGQPLVDGQKKYEIAFGMSQSIDEDTQNPIAENHLIAKANASDNFEGILTYDGTDEFEYTIQITRSATATQTPQFQVSLDGGTTWIKDNEGNIETFTVTLDDAGNPNPITVKELELTFSQIYTTTTDPTTGAVTYSGMLTEGDRFEIVPKKALYWIEPTRGPENITPQVALTGADNTNRVTGGSLAAYFGVRDDCCGRYLDELDALANTLIWEVNRLHTQGAGLTKLTSLIGQEVIPHSDVALGSAESGNVWYKDLQSGNVNFYFYDTVTNEYLGTGQLEFGLSTTNDLGRNFDPAQDTLNDVIDALNTMTIIDKDGNTLKDSSNNPINPFAVPQTILTNDKVLLQVTQGQHLSFAFGEDTAGLLAALGLNTYFGGNSAASITLSTDLATDYTKLSAGRVNGQYEVNEGDNSIANAIGGLANKNVTINTFWKTVSQSLPEYYAGLVSTVGSDKLHSETNQAYHKTLAEALKERKDGVSGVNLDEEMTNLVKYQSAYKAAAKLITTADEMLGVLIGLKQ